MDPRSPRQMSARDHNPAEPHHPPCRETHRPQTHHHTPSHPTPTTPNPHLPAPPRPHHRKGTQPCSTVSYPGQTNSQRTSATPASGAAEQSVTYYTNHANATPHEWP